MYLVRFPNFFKYFRTSHFSFAFGQLSPFNQVFALQLSASLLSRAAPWTQMDFLYSALSFSSCSAIFSRQGPTLVVE
jgi:hypothetical protein